MDALATLCHAFVESEQTRYGLVGIGHTDQSGRNRLLRHEIGIDKYDARLRGIEIMGIFGIGKEGDGSSLAFLNFCKGLHTGIGITFDRSAKIGGNLLGCKLHILSFVPAFRLRMPRCDGCKGTRLTVVRKKMTKAHSLTSP